ncbi:MAG TPA: Nramp family divalent metal transporter [Longimicrobiales bacterium]|nr:Nramp family divalent metal transporter [Longimicrobiales bacterium]
MVAAAFIGPGTVTTCTLAGARYGYALLWALGFSVIATLVLQEMAARLGLATGQGLGEAVRRRFDGVALRLLSVSLIVSAIAVGNAAYETGNLLGAGLGIDSAIGGGARLWALLAGGGAALLLWRGSYRVVERFLVGLVLVMSTVFLATAALVGPALGDVLRGLLVPSLPGEGGAALLVAVGLIGTTVVPYNLFLHAAAVGEKWGGPEDLPTARLDLLVAILLGGVVSAAIVVTSAAAAGTGDIAGASDMARQLEPLLGRWARGFFALGLAAAGLSSAITAPLAAAYATAGALGWKRDLRDVRLRAVWITVLLAGMLFTAVGVRPVPAILFAQVANGVLLPAVAVFLLLAANDRRWMGQWVNTPIRNLMGVLVVLVALGLGLRAVWNALAA